MPEPMHERRSWELAHDALARNDELGWHLLEHPARLAIRTIDSFCAGLRRSMPWLSELGGMPEITDDARAHYEARGPRHAGLADDFEEVRILLEHLDVDVQAAKDAIADMLGQRDQWLPLLAHGSTARAWRNGWPMPSATCWRCPDAMGWAEALSGPARLAATQLQEGGKTTSSRRCSIDRRAAARRLCAGRVARAGPSAADRHRLVARKTVNKNLGFPAKCAHKRTLRRLA